MHQTLTVNESTVPFSISLRLTNPFKLDCQLLTTEMMATRNYGFIMKVTLQRVKSGQHHSRKRTTTMTREAMRGHTEVVTVDMSKVFFSLKMRPQLF